MKVLIILALTASTSAFAADSGKTFFNKPIKKQICSRANKAFNTFSEVNCNKSKFVFAADKTQLKIAGVKKPLTTLMKHEFTLDGITYLSTTIAKVEITKAGKLKRTGWEVLKVSTTSFTDKAALKDAYPSADNVTEVKISEINKRLYKKMLATSLESMTDSEAYGQRDTTVSEGADQIYKVFHPSTEKLIGYIIKIGIASENADLKEFYTITFDSKGKFVDYSVEGFGYHE